MNVSSRYYTAIRGRCPLPSSRLILPAAPARPPRPSPPPPRERGTRVCTVHETGDAVRAGPRLEENRARGDSTRGGGAQSTAAGERVTPRRAVGGAHAPRRLAGRGCRRPAGPAGWDWGGRGQGSLAPGPPPARLRSPSNRRRTRCGPRPRQLGPRLWVPPARRSAGSAEACVNRSCAGSSVAEAEGSLTVFIAYFPSRLPSSSRTSPWVRKEKGQGKSAPERTPPPPSALAAAAGLRAPRVSVRAALMPGPQPRAAGSLPVGGGGRCSGPSPRPAAPPETCPKKPSHSCGGLASPKMAPPPLFSKYFGLTCSGVQLESKRSYCSFLEFGCPPLGDMP
ncbi:WAS/WASL-interacting protein family member 3-like [Mirounga angustirostris]|uniref:WAS/WASL-interacting protein family member 3-like n=1 Tax=Mirounga angustirostris TaxID=9716 RepID=UPI00313D8BD2